MDAADRGHADHAAAGSQLAGEVDVFLPAVEHEALVEAQVADQRGTERHVASVCADMVDHIAALRMFCSVLPQGGFGVVPGEAGIRGTVPDDPAHDDRPVVVLREGLLDLLAGSRPTGRNRRRRR